MVAVITAGVFEETAFRGYALERLAPYVGGLVTLLYLWRRDLLLNMIAHSTIDAIGLIVVPALR